jgi:hypothetical protein
MKTLARAKAGQLWNQYWNEMRREWFKLEVLQDYTGEDECESLQKWYMGDRQGSLELLRLSDPDSEFTHRCREKLGQGVKLLRLRIIQKPISLYTAWELEFYKIISQSLRGEQVLVIEKADTEELGLPKGDMMIFDETRVAVNSSVPIFMTKPTTFQNS